MTNKTKESNSNTIPDGWVEATLGEVLDFVVDNRGKNTNQYYKCVKYLPDKLITTNYFQKK